LINYLAFPSLFSFADIQFVTSALVPVRPCAAQLKGYQRCNLT